MTQHCSHVSHLRQSIFTPRTLHRREPLRCRIRPMAGPDPVSVGELLRRYRIQSGLTQEELAERAGMSARAIRALETSPQRAPRTYTLALLESALDLTAADHALLEAAIRRQR